MKIVPAVMSADAEQRDGERLADGRVADPAVRDVGVVLAADLRPDREAEEEEGGDLDAAGGAGGAAADEHQHVVDRQRLRRDVRRSRRC